MNVHHFKAASCSYPNCVGVFRLAKSTLTLIPLLGIHKVVFSVVTLEQPGLLRSIWLFMELFLSSFQVQLRLELTVYGVVYDVLLLKEMNS